MSVAIVVESEQREDCLINSHVDKYWYDEKVPLAANEMCAYVHWGIALVQQMLISFLKRYQLQ